MASRLSLGFWRGLGGICKEKGRNRVVSRSLTLESGCSSKFNFCVSGALPDAPSSPM